MDLNFIPERVCCRIVQTIPLDTIEFDNLQSVLHSYLADQMAETALNRFEIFWVNGKSRQLDIFFHFKSFLLKKLFSNLLSAEYLLCKCRVCKLNADLA